jgi:putative transcriptional regulator
MNLHAGITIKSTADLNDTLFEDCVIYITEVNQNGALGFIINKPFNRNLNDLIEFKASSSFPLSNGGPVDKEHLYFIHRRPDVIPGGIAISNNIFMGGDFTHAVAGINNYTLSENDLRIFVGYCGWDAGELEAEINEGSWIITDDFIFEKL